MNALRQNKAACAYPAMLLNGVCASSGGVVMALLQERYGLSYQWSGLLLAMLSVGNLAAGFAAGMLPAHWGQRRTVLMLAGGAALGYGAMILTGSPWALLAAFTLVGVAKGTTLNTSSALIAAHARERTKCMNLIHACFATGSLLCPLFIAALGMGGLPWWAPMAGLALCGAALWGVFALAGLPGRTGDGARVKNDWSFLRSPRFWVLTGLVFFQNCTEISVTGWMVTYFKDVGILSGPAGQMTVTVIWGAMLAGRLCIAFVFPVKNSFRTLSLMSACCVGTYILLLMAKTPASALICLFLFGLAIAGVNPTAVAAGNALSGAGASGLSRPVFHIAVIGQKTLLHQHGGAVGPFHDAEALLLAYLGVGAVHDAFALSVVIGETNAVFSAQAVPGAAHFLRDALGKAHGFFRVGAPGRRGEAFKAVGLSRAFVAVGMNAQKQGSAGVGRGLCTLLDGAVLAVGARAHRRIVGVLLQKRIEGVYRLFAYFQFFDDRLRTGVEAAVSGIQRHGVGRLGLQQIRPVRVARELGR